MVCIVQCTLYIMYTLCMYAYTKYIHLCKYHNILHRNINISHIIYIYIYIYICVYVCVIDEYIINYSLLQ